MFSTSGGTLMAIVALLSLLAIAITSIFWLAARVARLSRQVSLCMRRTPAPEKWESRLRELADDVSSLSSSHEKTQRLLSRLNSRAGMRELRADPNKADAPPPGTPKAALRAFYNVGGNSGRDMQAKMALVQREQRELSTQENP